MVHSFTQQPLARYWLTVARSQRVGPDVWKCWADDRIAECELPENWLIGMSLANNFESLRSALIPKLGSEPFDECENDDALLGHLWLRYELGEIELREFLELAGKASDSSEAEIECEEVYKLLNELKRSGDERSINEDAKRLFLRARGIAQKQWNVIFGPNH